VNIEGLSPHAAQISTRALDEEETRREHVVVSVSGAHAYGFPSPDSDVDLKGVHVAPTRSLLGLRQVASSADRVEIIEGVEIDYTSNELGAVVAGLLGGNGNYLERVAGHCVVRSSSLHAGLREVALASLSRRYYRHYAGFAHQLSKAHTESPSVKRALYVIRTALTGAHLLDTGELRIDVRTVMNTYGCDEAQRLVEAKLAGERTPMTAAEEQRVRPLLERALAALDAAHASSNLPDEPANAGAAEEWLVGARSRSPLTLSRGRAAAASPRGCLRCR
jgi:predicted nucleotidyltransferase